MIDDADADKHVKPYVHDTLDVRSLHFSLTEIQSRMQLQRPHALDLEYTRTMMGWLLFKPLPERIAMIGLGGGSLAKFCHRHVPLAAIVAVEINPHVIALRDAFLVPPDSARFQIIEADGGRFVRDTGQRFDVLLVDAFDAQGMPAALGAQRFYDDCLDVLQPGGLLVVNLHAGHRHCPVYIERIRRSFGENVLRVDDRDGSNSVVFASQGAPLQRAASSPPQLRDTLAAEAWKQLQGAFARVASAMDRGPQALDDTRPIAR